MGYAQRISSLVRSLRKKENIRVRQPLQKILLPILEDDFEQQVEAVKDLILAEVNVKAIKYIQGSGGIIKKKIKPNFKTLGKRLGAHMKIAAGLISQFTQEDIQKIEDEGQYELNIHESGKIILEREDFEITTEDIPGWLVASEGGLTVALDITISPSLQAEGLARELVNRIQNIRKERDFNVTDKIKVYVSQHEALQKAIDEFSDHIKAEVLAKELITVGQLSGTPIELVDGIEVAIEIEQVI